MNSEIPEPNYRPYGWNSLEEDPDFPDWKNWTGAVLLNDEIRRLCEHKQFPLIDPFQPRLLKPARYQLTLGDEARVDGERKAITKEEPLVIAPHQVAIVRTFEKLNIPRFLIARWNLRVDMVYRGLLWVGALQVDPGWVGYLPCPLYNMSDKPVKLYLGEPLFTIDFVRTTPFREGICKRYGRAEFPNGELRTYDPQALRSGPYDALNQLKGFSKVVRNLRTQINTTTAVLFTALGALVAALSIVAIQPGSEKGLVAQYPTIPLIISIIALVFSIAALHGTFGNGGPNDVRRRRGDLD